MHELVEDRSYGIIPVHFSPEGVRFLVIQHRAGHWGFPKGHAEAGEEPLDAARRELAEETGLRDCVVLDTQPVYERYRCRRRGRETNKTVQFYVARVWATPVVIQEAEIHDFAWLAAAAAAARLTFESGRQTLAAAVERVTQHEAGGPNRLEQAK